MMSIIELHLLEQKLIQYIYADEISKVFNIIPLYDFFEGYQKFQREFLHNNLQKTSSYSFISRFIMFIYEKITIKMSEQIVLSIHQQEKSAFADFIFVDKEINQINFYFARICGLQTISDRILAYNQLIDLKPDLAKAYFERGELKYDLNKYIEAVEDYTQAIRYNLNSEEVYFQRGFIQYNNLSNYTEAINDFTQVILLNPMRLEAYFICGLSKMRLKQYKNAITYFQEYLKIAPDNPYNYYCIALCYTSLQDKQNTLQYLQKTLQIQPTHKFEIQDNEVFDWLWEDEDFQKLVA